MLYLSSAGAIGPLARALADVLVEAPDDPMTPDWVAVGTAGMQRWLALELARFLGASGAGTGDGVAANITFTFPDALRQAVLSAGRAAGSNDPWHVDHLVWAVLDVLDAAAHDDRLGPLLALPDGATRFGRARRLADLFDRYAVRRPELVAQWHAGNDVDATGRVLDNHDLWQPHLWRLVRARIGSPSPVERLPELLEQLRAGALLLDLPKRLAVFGVMSLPGGTPFVDLVEALAASREIHLFLLDPSPAATARVRAATQVSPPSDDLLRVDDRSDEVVRHPLLRSWGRPYRERTVQLAAADVAEPSPIDTAECKRPATLLARVQDDLHADVAPAGDFDPEPEDQSIQVHSCQGLARQVEVLRDAILHLLADDPTLREDDIVVLCPAIAQFAPIVEGGFGPSIEQGGDVPDGSAPRLRYRITDRSLRESSGVLSAFEALLELVSGRSTATELLAFVALAPVRRRFQLDDEALTVIAEWSAMTNVRWGFDGEHRERWGVPAEFTANSWRATLDRVLLGVAVSDDDLGLASGEIAPLGVEGSDITVAGRFADLVARLQALTGDLARPRPASEWCQTLSDIAEQFLAVDIAQQWQLEQLGRIITEIGEQAVVGNQPATTELTLADVSRMLADRLQGMPKRSDFFRGGVTVSSLTPLRGVPFRVVCLLGFDDAGTSGGPGQAHGDDLAALAPRLGDRDPRSETRQALLEAVLAAGEHLVITRTGRDIRTNRDVPPAVAYAELRDTIMATLSSSSRTSFEGRIETVHPRQSFDDRCFEPGALNRPGPWSFDPGALAGAVARADRIAADQSTTTTLPVSELETSTVITLGELRSFFNHPVKAFLRGHLGLHLTTDDGNPSDDLPTAIGGLERWSVMNRLVTARLAGRSTDEWEHYERALGTLPPGGLGDLEVAKITSEVDGLLDAAVALGIDPTLDNRLAVDVGLADGTRIVGEVAIHCPDPMPGPAVITPSRAAPKQHLAAWLDLMALMANDPESCWRSTVVRRAERGDKTDALEIIGKGSTAEERRGSALIGLEVAVDCYRRGWREPIPLFSKLSPRLYAGDAKADDWNAFGGGGDGDDESNQIAFGKLTFDELCSVPARPDDPDGPETGRAERFATYLWSAVEASSEHR